MQKLIALIVSAGFVYLASYSYAKYGHTPQQHAKQQWSSHNAALLAEAYGLTADDVSKPVAIWRRQ